MDFPGISCPSHRQNGASPCERYGISWAIYHKWPTREFRACSSVSHTNTSNLRYTVPTSQNSTRRQAHGNLFLAWKIFNSNLPCLTPTSVLHSRLYLVFRVNTPLRSVHLTGTVCSNLWSITNVQGKRLSFIFHLTNCSSRMSLAGRICIALPRSQSFLRDMTGTHDSCLQRGRTMLGPSVPVLDSSSSVLSGLREKSGKLGGLERLVRRSRLVKWCRQFIIY